MDTGLWQAISSFRLCTQITQSLTYLPTTTWDGSGKMKNKINDEADDALNSTLIGQNFAKNNDDCYNKSVISLPFEQLTLSDNLSAFVTQHLAKHVMQVHLNAAQTGQAQEGELSLNFLKKYIGYCRK